MCNRKSVVTALSVLVLGLLLSSAGHAWGAPNDRNYLTFSGPVALPGVTLAPGTYIFECADQNVTNLVRVSSKDRRHVYVTAFTTLAERPAGLPADRLVTFSEAPRGIAPPIKVWFPVGERLGHEFIY
jgi:hypothetical protein